VDSTGAEHQRAVGADWFQGDATSASKREKSIGVHDPAPNLGASVGRIFAKQTRRKRKNTVAPPGGGWLSLWAGELGKVSVVRRAIVNSISWGQGTLQR